MRCEGGRSSIVLLEHLRINAIVKVYKLTVFLSLDATSSEKDEIRIQRLHLIVGEGMALSDRNRGKLELPLQ